MWGIWFVVWIGVMEKWVLFGQYVFFFVEVFGVGMQQNWQVFCCFVQGDVFGGSMGGDQVWQVVEYQFGYLVGQFVVDFGVVDQDIVDCYCWYVLFLVVVGVGGNVCGVVGWVVDFCYYVCWDCDEGDWYG